jgi:DDE family transposase
VPTYPVPVSSCAAVEATLATIVASLGEPTAGRQPGRPAILPAAALWAAVAVGVLKGGLTQVGVWRRICSPTWWYRGQIQISKEAVYHRLDRPGPSPMQTFFSQITAVLLAGQGPVPGCDLAPGFTEVVALDASTLDKIPLTMPHLRPLPPDDATRLAGKLTAVLDLRRQLFRRIDWHAAARQNEKVGAREAVADLPTGSLILADLGYFSFRWFDELTAAGQFWLTKHRGKGTYEEIAVLYEDGPTRDVLVWLGTYRADKAAYPARLIQFAHAGTRYQYLTNVLDPDQLSMADVATLYARRWDIELAFKLVKTDLQLSVIWSAKPAVVAHQVWAVLVIAQLVLMLRNAVATRAQVPDVYMVSMPLLVTYLPQYALHTDDPVGLFAEVGPHMGFIRPSRRKLIMAPHPPPGRVRRPTIAAGLHRTPRYAGKLR